MSDQEKKPLATMEEIPDADQSQEIVEGAITPFEGDVMDVTIEVSKKLEDYEKALNMILNFIVKRCYPGDFVSHSKMSVPLDERTVSINGAAAERIARDLGIQESNRTKPEKIFDKEKPGHYQFRCEGDFTFRGRTVHAIGISSTLNPFYGKKYGENVNPNDIREDHVMRDCLHDCVKQGVKGLFGLRNIPISKLRELGFDIAKVKFVNFKESEKSAAVVNPTSNAIPEGAESPTDAREAVTIVIEFMEARVSKKGKAFYSVQDSEGAKYQAWGDAKSERVIALMEAHKTLAPIRVVLEKKGDFTSITAVLK